MCSNGDRERAKPIVEQTTETNDNQQCEKTARNEYR